MKKVFIIFGLVLLAVTLIFACSFFEYQSYHNAALPSDTYTGNGDAIYLKKRGDTKFSGPYAATFVTSDTEEGGMGKVSLKPGEIFLDGANETTNQAIGQVIDSGRSDWFGIRHKGKFYIGLCTGYSGVSDGTQYSAFTLQVRNCLGTIPAKDELQALTNFLPHVTSPEFYTGTPIQTLSTLGTFTQVTRQMTQRHLAGVICKARSLPSNITIQQIGQQPIPLSQWPYTVTLPDGRRIYYFESPTINSFSGSKIPSNELTAIFCSAEYHVPCGDVSAQPGTVSLLYNKDGSIQAKTLTQ